MNKSTSLKKIRMLEYLLELCLRSRLIMLTGFAYFNLLICVGGGAPDTDPRPLLLLLRPLSSADDDAASTEMSAFESSTFESSAVIGESSPHASTPAGRLVSPSVTVGILTENMEGLKTKWKRLYKRLFGKTLKRKLLSWKKKNFDDKTLKQV